jgi:hypothetical protein
MHQRRDHFASGDSESFVQVSRNLDAKLPTRRHRKRTVAVRCQNVVVTFKSITTIKKFLPMQL